MAGNYRLFKFYVNRQTQSDLVQFLEDMPPHQQGRYIRDAIRHYQNSLSTQDVTSVPADKGVVRLSGIIGDDA